jgi:hypothetical protein
MLTVILLILAAAIAAVLVVAALKPSNFRIERAATFERHAPADIYPLLADFQHWREWSPWESLDPGMKRTYSGADQGVGAVYAWDGNRKVGSGRMEIVEARPGELVRLKLDFLAPMKARNMTDFILARQGNGTRVTWSMYGPSPYMSRLFGTFVSIDKLVGQDFQRGLVNLQAVLND